MFDSDRILQQRALRLARVQKFDDVLACNEKQSVSKKSALFLGDERHEQGRGRKSSQKNLSDT